MSIKLLIQNVKSGELIMIDKIYHTHVQWTRFTDKIIVQYIVINKLKPGIKYVE
jgi:hypothetical protein